jgi:hypothetical protein
MSKFAWKKQAENNVEIQTQEVSAETFAQVVSQINEKYGRCTPELVVERAESPESPIHNLFIWDDTEAAKRFRLFQAAYAIRSVQIVRLSEETAPQREGLVITKPEEEVVKRQHLTLEEALGDKKTRKVLAEKVVMELRGMRERFGDLSELEEVWSSIDRV